MNQATNQGEAKMLHKKHPLMEMARRAKRAGFSTDVLCKGLKPEFKKFIPDMLAEFDRFKPRKSA